MYIATGRVQVSPFLDARSARQLHHHIRGRKGWQVIARAEAEPPIELDAAAWQSMSLAHREGLLRLAQPTGLKGFRYFYEQIRLPAANDLKPSSLLDEFARLLSSEPVLRLVRAVTGAEDIATVSARATRFGPGHFLTEHVDAAEGMDRRVAFALGLTGEWRPEWGGLLMFHDENGDIVSGLMPRLNVLNLFTVPQRHSVSLVAPFAPEPRYSITGWFKVPSDGRGAK